MRFWRRIVCNPCTKEGNTRQIAVDALIPIFAIPLLLLISSLGLICTLLVFIVTPLLIFYAYQNFLRFIMRTKFFLMWTVTSVLMLLIIFEVSVVPLLEILPEENYVFVFCVVGSLICGYMTKRKASYISQEGSLQEELELGEDCGNICNICRRRSPPKTIHCKLCQACILGREYHCKWLGCCIGASNLRYYLGCLFFSAIAFIYGSNLTMTSICHPFVFVATILLPDDCSDAYHQLDIAICFVSSLYSLLIGLIVLSYLMYHIWLLYLGKTANEQCLIMSESQSTKGILKKLCQLSCCKL